MFEFIEGAAAFCPALFGPGGPMVGALPIGKVNGDEVKEGNGFIDC